MDTGSTKVHEKDQALFERIDATLAAYDAALAESLPAYVRAADQLPRSSVTTKSMAPVSLSMSSGSMAGKSAIRS